MVVETGVRPRVVARAIVACVRGLVPELEDEPPWRGLLHVADAFGRGEMNEDALRQLLPGVRGPIPNEWHHAMKDALGPEVDSVEPSVASHLLIAALHPALEAEHRSRTAGLAIGYLAGVPAARARTEARDSVVRTLEEQRGALPQTALVHVPAVGSAAWDETSHRAYAYALGGCADEIRRLVPKPWARRR